jgi:uncharacterized protein YdaU (DUF1376 family)
MSKDPACLFYIGDWLTSTAEMDADCRGWYLNLLLHNYDKGTLPCDLEKLAVLCNVKFSEYKRFEHVFEQVLKQKFEILEDGRLTNQRTQSILRARELFKDKRSNARKMSYLMRFFYKKYKKEALDTDLVDFIRANLDLNIDTKNEHMIEQVFKQMFELYKNENEIENKDIDKIDFEKFLVFWNDSFKNSIVPKLNSISDERKKALNKLLKKYKKEDINIAITKSKNSNLLMGLKGDWKMNFDWFVKPVNFQKILDGNYDAIKHNDTPKQVLSTRPEQKILELTEEEKYLMRKESGML